MNGSHKMRGSGEAVLRKRENENERCMIFGAS
jgi:hypothetical protein